MKSKNKLEPIEYYDNISLKYDATLSSDPANTKIRDEVKQYFLNKVNGKYVLDFGGGTGKDLEWLIDNGFTVYFCEPAKGMKDVAIKNFQNVGLPSKVIFLDDEYSDFQNWTIKSHPFKHKVDGILSNFAVFNSIKQIEMLSDKLALVSSRDSHLIISVLNVRPHKIFSRNFPTIFYLFLIGHGLATIVKTENHKMIVYLHTKTKLVKAFKKYFDYIESFPITDSTFRLFHFLRNEKAAS